VYCNSIVKEIEQSSFVQVFIVLIILNMSMKLTLKLITNYIKVEKAQSVHLGLNPHYQCPTGVFLNVYTFKNIHNRKKSRQG